MAEELTAVDAAVKGKGRLSVNEIVFELNTVAVEKVGGKGGVDLKVISLGGDVTSERSNIHKVTVKVGVTNEPFYVAWNPIDDNSGGTDA